MRHEADLGRRWPVRASQLDRRPMGRAAVMPAAVVLGSLTIPGRPEQVSRARAFVTGLAERTAPGATVDTAALLTSELVTNAMLHTSSGTVGGEVTVVVVNVPGGLMIEILDNGSPDHGPQVQDDRYAAHGHGLFLVEQLASRWGFQRGMTGTAVWFQLDHEGMDDRP